MSETKWTPGPWTVEDPMGPENLWIVEAGKQTYEWRCIAMVCVDDEEDDGPMITPAMQKANAALIAAGPALYAALDDLLREAVKHLPTDSPNGPCDKAIASARAALSAARGEG